MQQRDTPYWRQGGRGSGDEGDKVGLSKFQMPSLWEGTHASNKNGGVTLMGKDGEEKIKLTAGKAILKSRLSDKAKCELLLALADKPEVTP